MHLAFKYFELDDIVPIATKIFEEVGLISIVNFYENAASMYIFNTDNPEEEILFRTPIVTLAENKGTNAVQAFGATITYFRRYLYMIALDICEPDSIDPVAPGVTPSQPKTSVTTAKTENTSLTNGDSNATDLQIKQMKELLKKLREIDPTKEEWIAQIAVDTKGFTVISRTECEKLTKELSEMIKAGE